MNQTIIAEINLENLLKEAKQETFLMIENGIDISDNSIITPLEWTANQYPEIAERCNQCLIELIQEQMSLTSDRDNLETINEF
jgi:L-ribulose-5-phosphate 3-epimerase UlaE